MNKKILAVMLATLMSATMLAGMLTVSAEETKEEAYYYEFDVPTDHKPDYLKKQSEDQGPLDAYVDLVCYDASFSNIGADTKYASFYIHNAGNMWAQAVWYTSILMDGEEEAWKTHIIDLGPGSSRWCSKLFNYEPDGYHTFQCWTDSSEKFSEGVGREDNNYDPGNPIPYVWVN